ncbi:MAG: dethiobiotin synthase [Lysobacter sp.]|nr:dethiobiotin synthase [Lysobacter sp.]MDQ3289028.1 dethiobiotin synthase [Pseudomonadota bacterium]
MARASIYVTGTDTGVGKTLVSTSILHALRARGLRAVGMKPVASGCRRVDEQWRNEDALLLQAASEPRPAYMDLNPYALIQPLAPEVAARDEGVQIELEPMLRAWSRLAAQADAVVVEGVGGWAAPLSPSLDQCELVAALDLQVVMVVGLRLGCINHARLTARAIAADGARLIGWVASEIDPAMDRIDDSYALLHKRLEVPCWGRLPYRENASAQDMASTLQLPPWPPGTGSPDFRHGGGARPRM